MIDEDEDLDSHIDGYRGRLVKRKEHAGEEEGALTERALIVPELRKSTYPRRLKAQTHGLPRMALILLQPSSTLSGRITIAQAMLTSCWKHATRGLVSSVPGLGASPTM